MSIIIALIVFGVLVAVHEFGHFAVAKLSGIKVNKFAIGMGPILFKHTKGETEYSLRLLPIGGFCAMEGEDDDSNDERAFRNKSVGKRIAVVVAGAIMNLILGFIISVVVTSMMEKVPQNKVGQFKENSLSQQAGLQIGDEILEVNGLSIFTDYDISYQLSNAQDGVCDLLVKRDGMKIRLDDVPFYDKIYYYIDDTIEGGEQYVEFDSREEYTGSEELKEAYKINLKLSYDDPKTVSGVIGYSFRNTVSYARLIWISLVDLVRGKYGINDLSGPVGIVSAIDQVRVYGIEEVLRLVMLITINLGIFNLLPLPALDGGRLVFLIIEAIRRKPIPAEKEGMVHFIGMALLMVLMVIVMISDVKKLFN
ncbi:MAG: site-2 protease family protein [Oscillospiraceae bacterium]|nr:site-2 protease family protein [Oscillospiraceae bacterium]